MCHLSDVLQNLEVEEQDVIYLTTKSGSKVVPMKQFGYSIDEMGRSHYKVSPFIVLAWDMSRLSRQDEWTTAVGFFYPRQGETKSICEKMLSTELSRIEKIRVINGIFENEFDRVGWEGSKDAGEAFKLEFLTLVKRYGGQFTDELE